MSPRRKTNVKTSHKALSTKVDALFVSGGVNEKFATNLVGILRALRERKTMEKLTNAQVKRELATGSLKYVNQRLYILGQKPITIEEALAWINRKLL